MDSVSTSISPSLAKSVSTKVDLATSRPYGESASNSSCEISVGFFGVAKGEEAESKSMGLGYGGITPLGELWIVERKYGSITSVG